MEPLRQLPSRLRRLWSGSIRRRLILGIGALFAVVMSVFVADMVLHQNDFLHRENAGRAAALAQTLAANSVSWALASDFAGLQEVVQSVRGFPDLRYAMILARDGRVLAHTDPTLTGRYARDEVSDALLRAPPQTRLLLSTSALIDVAAPIQANGTHLGWARAALSQDTVNANLRTIAHNGIIYAAIGIALGTLLAVALTRGLTHALARLVKATRKVSSGERGVQSGLRREDELGELSHAFDNMTSDLDRANKELRESEEKFRQVSASAQDAIIVIDQDGAITDWNAAAQKIFGYAAAEVIGRDLHALLALPAQHAVARQGLQQFRHSGTGPVVNKTFETTAVRRDGAEFPVELSISAVRLRGQWHAIGIVRDITQRRLADETLRRSEASLNEAQRIAHVGNWELDLSSNALTWTDEIYRIFEIDPRKFGASYEAFVNAIHPDDRERVSKAYADSVTNKTPYSIEHRLLMDDGRVKYVNEQCETAYDHSGRPLRSVGTVQDITARKQAERQLTLVNFAMNHVREAAFVIDKHAHFHYVNDDACRTLEYSREELLGLSVADVDPDFPLQRWSDHWRELQGRKSLMFEGRHRTKSGRIFPVEIAANYFEHEGRGYNLALVRDITERKWVEQKLLESEQRLRLHVERTPLAVIEWDTDFRVLHWNPAAERIFGYTAAEAMGRHASFIVAGEAKAAVDEVWRRLLSGRGGERSTNSNVTKDGRAILCEWYNTALVTSGGKVIGVASLVEDVTVRKQAELARTQLAAIVQSSHDAIIGKDLDGVITSWNPGAEKVYGYRAEEVVGKPVSILAPEGRTDEIAGLLERVRRGEAVMNFETERYRKDGRRIDISLDISPIRDASGRVTGASTIARDVTEKKQAERALKKLNRALKALSSCNEALIHASDERQLLDRICRLIIDIEGYRMAWVGYVEHDEKRTVRPVAQGGYEAGYLERAQITWGDNERGGGPLGIAIRSGQMQVVQDVNTDPRFEPWRANAVKLGYGSVLVAPLLSDSGVLGALSIYAESVNAFDAAEIALLGELAADMAFGIVTLRTRGAQEQSAARLQLSMEATIQAIAGTVEMRDPYTAGHQRRVAELATAIAQELGLTQDQVRGVHLAGVVHDLGKIHIPAEILSKPGKLTRIEFELIKAHPEAGYEILKGVDFPWPIAQIVFQHHERLDGSGYPRGLKADEILLEARIIAVADVVEAMSSHRPYRPSLGLGPALQEISANAGKYYDADAARVCVALFREQGFAFRG